MKNFNFPKRKRRNNFTKIFGGAGTRRFIQELRSYIPSPLTRIFMQFKQDYKNNKRFKMNWVRRSHQGWRNKTFGSIQALKIRLQFGRRRSTPQFRR